MISTAKTTAKILIFFIEIPSQFYFTLHIDISIFIHYFLQNVKKSLEMNTIKFRLFLLYQHNKLNIPRVDRIDVKNKNCTCQYRETRPPEIRSFWGNCLSKSGIDRDVFGESFL